jgi:hypothetical protein
VTARQRHTTGETQCGRNPRSARFRQMGWQVCSGDPCRAWLQKHGAGRFHPCNLFGPQCGTQPANFERGRAQSQGVRAPLRGHRAQSQGVRAQLRGDNAPTAHDRADLTPDKLFQSGELAAQLGGEAPSPPPGRNGPAHFAESPHVPLRASRANGTRPERSQSPESGCRSPVER